MGEAKKRGIVMRILGSIAFRIHCQKFRHWHESLNRRLTDVDFVTYYREVDKVEKLLFDFGCTQDEDVYTLHGKERRIFYYPGTSIHSDVFIDKLRFCHEIDFSGRLEIDDMTISLVDLLLEKMQIVQINEKDIIDTIMLFREHYAGPGDTETINTDYLAALCGKDWGLWKTVTDNLEKVNMFLTKYQALTDEDRADVSGKIKATLDRINQEPKSVRWKLRARIGDKVKWYNEVDEVDRG
ncbi:MAG: hypothetical protein ACOY40_01260 [Bacillota bacterium]